MSVFINTIFKSGSGIVQVIPKNINLKADDFHECVKSFYNISGNIQFSDSSTLSPISNEILLGYVNQYRNSPGWALSISEITEEYIEASEIKIEEMDFNSFNEETNDNVCSSIIDTNPTITETITSVLSVDSVTKIPKIKSSKSKSYSSNSNRSKYPHDELKKFISAETVKNMRDLEMRMIHAYYENTKTLTNNHRIKMSKILIKIAMEVNPNFGLNKTDLLYVANVVCEVFPSEICEVYYTAAENRQKATGKLYDLYTNYRRQLSSVGLLETRKMIKIPINVTEKEVSDRNKLLDIEFVKTQYSCCDLLTNKWIASYAERVKILEDTNITTKKYLSMFPIFKSNDPATFDLIAIDAKKLYPGIKEINQNWNVLYKQIIMNSKELTHPNVKMYLNAIKKNQHEDIQKAVAFLILPYFFPVTNLKRTVDKQRKFSKIDVQNDFVSHFNTLTEMDKYDKEFTETSVVKPRLYFIGNLDNLKAHVKFNNNGYNIDSPIDAVQHIARLYLALNVQYPPICMVVWNFIQKYVFEVTTKNDMIKPSILSVYHTLMQNS